MSTRALRVAPWVAGAALLLTLGLAYGGKAVCIDGEPGFWGETRYCYSDVRVLWSFRGFDVDALPYAPPPPGYPHDYTFEYPPLLGFPAHLIALATDSRRGFFDLHALSFAVAGLVTLAGLHLALRARGQSPWRLLGFALSPALVLFGMLNWDLWAVAAAAVGLAAAARGRPRVAAVAFGVGAATKWWPGLLVLTLVAGPWAARRRRLDWRPVAVTAGVWTALQVPAVLVSPAGWFRSVTFQFERLPNFDSVPSAIAALGRRLAPGPFWGETFSRLYTGLSLAVLAAVVVFVVRRLTARRLDPGDAALVLVGALLLTGKVFSPQFVLWLIPVAVVARVPWTPVIAVEASNAAVWLLFGPWMAHLDDPAFGGFLRAAQAMTVVRAATIVWLVAAALLARQEEPGEHRPEAADTGEEPQPLAVRVPGE